MMHLCVKGLCLSLVAGTAAPAIALTGPPCAQRTCSDTVTMTVMEQATRDIVDTAVNAGQFKTLVAAVGAAGLADALKSEGPFTVFAPTDEAFAALPEGTVQSLLRPENRAALVSILTYHVVPGRLNAAAVTSSTALGTLNGQRIDVEMRDGKVYIDNARVVAADVQCSNGVIHVINSVILPSTSSIVTTAGSAGTFSTLLAAAQAAGLAELLGSEGPFTVFAPTDEAFAKLPRETVESLLRPENRDQLAAILKYHVVPGRVYSSGVVEAGRLRTAQGGLVTARIREGRLLINGAKVIANDIDCSNGVIHVIDTVILPAG